METHQDELKTCRSEVQNLTELTATTVDQLELRRKVEQELKKTLQTQQDDMKTHVKEVSRTSADLANLRGEFQDLSANLQSHQNDIVASRRELGEVKQQTSAESARLQKQIR